MKSLFQTLALLSLLAIPLAGFGQGTEQSDNSASNDEDVFEYNVGEVDYLTGEGVNIGGFIFPELYVQATGGLFEPGSNAEDFSTSEHDPQNEGTIQAIELHFDLDFGSVVTGRVTGFGHQGEDRVWEAALEEAYLHYHANDNLSIGGGQFLNEFGFLSSRHVHGWDFVNRELTVSRMLNEGELLTQGGEIILRTPNAGRLTIGAGGVRSHAHEHEHGEEEEHEEEEEEEHHHLEADEAGFNDWVASLDYRFRLPSDPSVTVSTSFATGENGFGYDTHLYGFGIQKVWNGHDHGQGGPDFCTGAVMLRSEFIGRDVDAMTEDGDMVSFDDQGISTALFYGLSDQATVSVRHDWVSAVEMAELTDAHRISPALTVFLDPGQRVRARVQYDYTQNDAIGGEHAAWLQFQVQWGGIGGSHAGHGH